MHVKTDPLKILLTILIFRICTRKLREWVEFQILYYLIDLNDLNHHLKDSWQILLGFFFKEENLQYLLMNSNSSVQSFSRLCNRNSPITSLLI